MYLIRPVQAADAALLFPMIFQTDVTNTILWNGPENLATYESGLKEKEELTRAGKEHMFTLFHGGSPAGTCSFRPYEDGYRADLGLWIGLPFQNKGVGSFAVAEMLRYGFSQSNIQKIEATVFTNNPASRRIFEKNGFRLEGTIRMAIQKRDELIDEWLLGITRNDYENHHHLEK